MNRKPLRVVKLGGSLLGYDQLREQLSAWLHLQPTMTTVLIVGGGPLVDAIRRLDAVHGLGDAAAHWAAIDALGVTARVVAELFPEFALVDELADIESRQDHTMIVNLSQVLKDNGAECELPWSWDVTSDSIAAWVAQATRSDELVLLKSDLLRAGHDLEKLAAEGYVDAYFPRAASDLECKLRLVNLRDAGFAEEQIRLGHVPVLGQVPPARVEGDP